MLLVPRDMLQAVVTDDLAAGFTFCALASLSFLSRLPQTSEGSEDVSQASVKSSVKDLPLCIHWLLQRQTDRLDEDTPEPDTVVPLAGDAYPPEDRKTERWIGFNGRSNKVADTCYSWWALGSLAVSIYIPIHHMY